MTAETQVALVEDDTGMRERISRVVDADPSLSLAYSASNAADILGWLVDNPIDVLLVDLGLPDRPGLQVISQCRNMQPACAVMVLSIFGDEANMVQAFEAGASGYLLKDGTEADLATHIRHLRAGGSPMSPVIARKLLRRWQAHSGGAPRQQQPAAGSRQAGQHRAERFGDRSRTPVATRVRGARPGLSWFHLCRSRNADGSLRIDGPNPYPQYLRQAGCAQQIGSGVRGTQPRLASLVWPAAFIASSLRRCCACGLRWQASTPTPPGRPAPST
ncbi:MULTISPECIES: response regulator [unclassified Variovorax]|uniref:response regulator n=1 Tax=unclassified Variovorax TaxID=663243 RepID=UPI003F469344